MKNLTINELHPTVQNFVKGYNLEAYFNGEREVMTDKKTDAMELAKNIVSITPLSDRMKNCFLTGYDREIKSDGEYYGTGTNGITSMYDGYQIQSAILFADQYLKGETRIEVGMKYPTFSVKRFKKLFAIGEPVKVKYYTTSSGEDLYYDLYKDEKGNVFTFQVDGLGVGGYAGAVLVNETEAFKLVDFLCGSKSHYVKDLDIGRNGLGGLGIAEIDSRAAEFDSAAWVTA